MPLHMLRTIEGVAVRGKRVLTRIDADVDLTETGEIEPGGDHRLLGCVRTIEYLRAHGARVILLSHLGRPDGTVVERLRLGMVGARLAEHLERKVRTVQDIVGLDAQSAIAALSDGEILLLENVRFHPGEEANDPTFAKALGALGDLYVDEAFAVSHRAHASNVGITAFLESYAGALFAHEVQVLEHVLERPERPIVAIASGAKIETKVKLLRHLLPRVDYLLTGGGVANMFILAAGVPTGASLVEPDMLDEITALVTEFRERIVVPTDARVARDGVTSALVVPVGDVQPGDKIYDIGPETAARYCAILQRAKTCLWNGPVGKVELPEFQEGTRTVAACIQQSGAFSVVGGGDTVTALRQMHLEHGFRHVSTGGGAMIALLEGERLPAVDVLRKSDAVDRRENLDNGR